MLKEKWTRIKTDSTFRASCIQNMLIIAVILFIVLPIIVASSMSFYRGDDFTEIDITINSEKRNIIEIFMASVWLAKDLFLNWNGTFFSKFLVSFLSPLNGYGLIQLRILMVFNALLFVGGLVSFIFSIYNKEKITLRGKLLLAMCCFVGVLGFEAWFQAFYWWTGAAYYTIPLSMLLIAMSFILLSNKKISLFAAGILLFCAAGGTLAVAGMGCWWLLTLCISKFYKKELRKADILLFVTTVISAAINALAPGNFARHDVIDESGVHYFRAIIYSASEVIATGEWLFIDTPFIIIAIIALSIGIYIGKQSESDNTYSLLMIVMNAITPVVTYYPVCLGYSSGGGPNRCRFVLTFIFVVSIVNILVLTGKMIADKVKKSYTREAMVLIVLLLLTMPTEREGWKISEMIPYRTLMELTDGSIQEYYRDVNRVYDAIRTDENDNVFIYERPEDIDIFLPMNLNQDPEYLINTEIAYYYEKDSVQWILEPVYKSVDTGDTFVRIDPNSFQNDLTYVSVFNSENNGEIAEVQVLEPLEENLVVRIPKGKTGTVVVYVFADAKGENLVEQREFAY